MKVLLLASGEFAMPSLAMLKEYFSLEYVVTKTAKPCGRGLKPTLTPVGDKAKSLGLKVLTFKSTKTSEFVEFLAQHKFDVIVVIAFGEKLTSEVLNSPSIMPINLHASLLPKYRGSAPVNWALVNGESVTGVSVIKVTEHIDSGPILGKKEVKIENEENAEELTNRLSLVGANLLKDVLTRLNQKDCKLVAQDDEKVSYAPKLKKSDGFIDWNRAASDIVNHIRGMLPWPVAYTFITDKRFRIFKAHIEAGFMERSYSPGQVVKIDSQICILAGDGKFVSIDLLQPENGKLLTSRSFLAGHKIAEDAM